MCYFRLTNSSRFNMIGCFTLITKPLMVFLYLYLKLVHKWLHPVYISLYFVIICFPILCKILKFLIIYQISIHLKQMSKSITSSITLISTSNLASHSRSLILNIKFNKLLSLVCLFGIIPTNSLEITLIEDNEQFHRVNSISVISVRQHAGKTF